MAFSSRFAGRALTVLVALGLSFVGACSKSSDSSAASSARSDADVLRERAARFWDCRLRADYKSQYDLIDPAFKGRVALDAFVASQGKNEYQKYEVKDVTVDGETAYVAVEYVYKIGLRVPNLEPEPQTTSTEQEWVKVDGTWYFKYPENPFQAARDIASGRRRTGDKPK